MTNIINNWMKTISNESKHEIIKNKKIAINERNENQLMFEEDYLSIKLLIKDKFIIYAQKCKYIKISEWYNNNGDHEGEIVYKNEEKIKKTFNFLDKKIIREIPHYEKYVINKNETYYFFIQKFL